MVVIAIVASLAAVAVPSYKKYILKTEITNNYNILAQLLEAANVQYQSTGAFPASVTLNGINIPGWTAVGFENIYSVYYGVSNDGKGAIISASFSGLSGIPNYVEPSSTVPNQNTYSRVDIGVRDMGQDTQYACGTYTTSGADVSTALPPDFMPAGCGCDAVYYFYQNGSSC
jgi:type II secretory pathway pseudopilin PulG